MIGEEGELSRRPVGTRLPTHVGVEPDGGLGRDAVDVLGVVLVVGEAVAELLVVGPLLAEAEVEHREGRVARHVVS